SPPILSISGGGARFVRLHLEVDRDAIKEATATGVADPRNIDGRIEWFGGLKMRDLGSEIGHRYQCARRHFPLQAQVPRLGVRWSQIGITRLVNAVWDKRHVGVQAKRMRIPPWNAGPGIIQTARRSN